jgi:hypothetical protein
MVPVVVFTAAFYTGQVSFLSFCADLELILMMMGYSAASLGAGGGGPFCYCMQRFLIMDGTWKNRFFFVDVVGWVWQAGDEGRVLAFGLTGWD